MPLPGDVRLEALLTAGYALGLLLVALGLERAAHLIHGRAEQYQTAGFRYHAALDVWECPTGEHLLPIAVDQGRRFIRYRARAAVCNRCPLKDACTDADDGRQVLQSLDAWSRSDLGRFYRGLSLTLILLGACLTGVGLVRNHGEPEVLVLGTVLVLLLGTGGRLWPAFRQPGVLRSGENANGALGGLR